MQLCEIEIWCKCSNLYLLMYKRINFVVASQRPCKLVVMDLEHLAWAEGLYETHHTPYVVIM